MVLTKANVTVGQVKFMPAGQTKAGRGDLLRLDGLRLLNGSAQCLHHFVVLKAVHDVLQDVAVAHKAQCSEDNENGDI